MLDRTAEAVVIADARQPHLPIIAANQTCLDTLPPHGPDPIGQPWAAIFPQAAAHGLATIARRAIATGEPCAIPGLVLAAHGPSTLTYFDWQCRPLADGDGVVRRVAILGATVRRVAAHRQGPEHPFAVQPPLGFALVTGADHIVGFANVALAALLGSATPISAGARLFALHPGLTQPAFVEALELARATNQSQSIDRFEIATPQREQRHWALRMIPTVGGDEHPGGILLVVSDITAQAKTDREAAMNAPLPPQVNQFAALLAAITEGAFTVDGAGILTAANATGRTLLALPAEALGLPFETFLTPPYVRQVDGHPFDFSQTVLQPLVNGAARASAMVTIAATAGEHHVTLEGTPIHDDDGAVVGAVIMAHDSTAQHKGEQEREAFLSLIAHELRSPLTSIKGFAQLAVRALDGFGAERAIRHLHVIDQQTERIGRLIGDISDVSRLQRGKLTLDPMPFDLVPIVEATVAQQRVGATAHPLVLTLPDEPLIVRADPARIEQSLTSLLTNAAQFSPTGSEITVTLERYSEGARLLVRDHGIGIPTGEHRRIFERFYRASNVGGGGLGLGLFIVAQIVARSGGTIVAEDAAGGGAQFCLTLPLARPDMDEER